MMMQPEWAPHERVWIGFPHDRSEWEIVQFDRAREQIARFALAVAADGQGEAVTLIVNDAESASVAQTLVDDRVDIATLALGDVWLRDTAPLIVGSGHTRIARDFAFNGWGGKFPMAGDEDLGERLARRFGLARSAEDWVLEGGAIDGDGAGLLVTTEQCLLNPNRNPGLDRADIEARLISALGARRILWLGEGLANDHTDGHVDNLARFVAPGVLALPVPADDDPNAGVYADARRRAHEFGVAVVDMPSPGPVRINGTLAAASYMNFYIGNATVVVPHYGVANDDAAVAALAALFPDRRVIGLPADAVLSGGGSFHCCSQQVPR